MKTITVNASRSYEVLLGAGILPKLGTELRKRTKARRAAVVSDSNVFPLYGETAVQSLRDAGFEVSNFVFPAGEQSKNLNTYGEILNFFAENRLERDDVAVALGGGVTGDITGFASASYRRGMDYVQVPTTLLAAVDSSVGGKTAVDLPAGKNLAGAFHQPLMVLCDTQVIASVPEEVFRDGCGEVIKYGFLGNAAFLEELELRPAKQQLEHIIEVCVTMKRDIVNADEFDRGCRALLNYGHSFGHAVEKCSSFTLSHGQCVGIGMVMMARAAMAKGYCGREVLEKTLALLKRCGLPTETEYSAQELFSAALSDKKMSGGQMHLIVPTAVGETEIVKIPAEEMEEWIRLGLGKRREKRTLCPGERTGSVVIPSSKSQMHRLLITAALSDEKTTIRYRGLSNDIRATADCLNALGAAISSPEEGVLTVHPITKVPEGLCELPCGESGSTLRFLLPLVGALGAKAVFHMEGRLPERPLQPLDALLREHGMRITKDGDRLFCEGQLCSGEYTIPGNISSQYVSGLLFALPLLEGESRLRVTGKLESEAYITMTEAVLCGAGLTLGKFEQEYNIPGKQKAHLPQKCVAEGDFSNAAFFLCMGALSEQGVHVGGLNSDSVQGDREVVEILRRFGAEVTEDGEEIFVRKKELRGIEIDAAAIPDLVPVLSVVAALAEGETHIFHAQRLRLKESDRLQTTALLLNTLGARVTETVDGLMIEGVERLTGGTVSSCGDHRIAMSAAAAALQCSECVTVEGAEAVNKSYPDFWRDYEAMEVLA